MNRFGTLRASSSLHLGLAFLASLASACGDDDGGTGGDGSGGGESTVVVGPTSTGAGPGQGGSGSTNQGGSGQGGDGDGGAGGEAPTCTVLPEIVRGPEDAATFQSIREGAGGFRAFATVFRNGLEELIFVELDAEGAPVGEVRVDVDPYALSIHLGEPTLDGGWVVAGLLDSGGSGSTFGGAELVAQSQGLGTDAFVAKLDASGQAEWIHSFGSADSFGSFEEEDDAEAAAYGLAIGADGTILVVGSVEGDVDLGDGVVRSTGESGSRFVLALDADGGIDWVRMTDDAWHYAVQIGADGRVVIGGADATRVLDADGEQLWEAPVAGWITVDDAGSVYVSSNDVIGYDWNHRVTKLDRDGNTLWTRDFETPAFETGRNVAVTPDLLPVVVLECEGPIDVGEGSVETCGGRDMCVVWLDDTGATVGSQVYGDGFENSVQSAMVAEDGAVWLAAVTWRNPTNGQDDEGFIYRVMP